MDFYALLGIPSDSDEHMIRSAYRGLARRYHPDRGPGSSMERFRQVTEAYETLIDGRSRHTYDRSLRRAGHANLIRVEPLTTQPGDRRQEDPMVFGRFKQPAFGFAVFRAACVFDDLFQTQLDSLDLFFRLRRPW